MNFQTFERAKKSIRKGASGVYVIAEPGEWGDDVVYVGESHSGKLKRTMTRHFQKWKGPTAGPTYSRRTAKIHVIQLKADKVLAVQNSLIKRLAPRDNTAEKPGWFERLIG
jgi:excinuclease UvrABC nuclease subunit